MSLTAEQIAALRAADIGGCPGANGGNEDLRGCGARYRVTKEAMFEFLERGVDPDAMPCLGLQMQLIRGLQVVADTPVISEVADQV